MAGKTARRVKTTAVDQPQADENAIALTDQAQEPTEVIPPTIVFHIDEYGDVQFGSPTPNMDLLTALAISELGRAKLVGAYYQNVNQEKAKILASRPSLIVPERLAASPHN